MPFQNTLESIAKSKGVISKVNTALNPEADEYHAGQAYEWLIGRSHGLIRGVQEAVATGQEELLSKWDTGGTRTIPLAVLIAETSRNQDHDRSAVKTLFACAHAVLAAQAGQYDEMSRYLTEATQAYGETSTGEPTPMNPPVLHGIHWTKDSLANVTECLHRIKQAREDLLVGPVKSLCSELLDGKTQEQSAAKWTGTGVVIDKSSGEGLVIRVHLQRHTNGFGELYLDPKHFLFTQMNDKCHDALNHVRRSAETLWNDSSDVTYQLLQWRTEHPQPVRQLHDGSLGGLLRVGIEFLWQQPQLTETPHLAISITLAPQGNWWPVNGLEKKIEALLNLQERPVSGFLLCPQDAKTVGEVDGLCIESVANVREAVEVIHHRTRNRQAIRELVLETCKNLHLLKRSLDADSLFQADRRYQGDPLDKLFNPKQKRILLLSSPGAGKTELQRQAARALADPADVPQGTLRLVAQAWWDRGKRLVPLYIELAEWQKWATNPKRKQYNLEDYIVEELHKSHLSVDEDGEDTVKEEVRQWLKRGDVLLLLDGCDEVRGNATTFWARLRQTLLDYPGCPAIITSREVGYGGQLDELNLPTYQIDPLTPKEQEAFVLAWFTEKGEKQEAKDHLLELLRTDPRVRPLSRYPRRLDILCFVMEDNPSGEPPATLGELYRRALDKFLDNSMQRESVYLSPAYKRLLPHERREVIAAFAYRFFAEGKQRRTEFSEEELLGALKDAMTTNGHDPQLAKDAFDDFIINSGLIQGRATSQYAFVEVSVQEYLTAAHLDAQAKKNGWKPIQNIVQQKVLQPEWHEVFRFMAGIVNNPDELLLQIEPAMKTFIETHPELHKVFRWAYEATKDAEGGLNLTPLSKWAAALFAARDIDWLASAAQTSSASDRPQIRPIGISLDICRRIMVSAEDAPKIKAKVEKLFRSLLPVTVRLIESKSPKGHLQAVTSGFLNLDRWEVYGNFDVGELQRGMEHITTTLIKEIPNLKDRRPLGLSVAEKAWRRATGYQLHLSREEWNTVEDYLEVVLLLVRCRNEARLEPSCWLGIVERLLTDMG